MPQSRVVGVKRQRDEGLESAGLVLERPQLQQVVDAVLFVLDVAVEHGAVRLEAQVVRRARHLDPLVGRDLVVADNAPHPFAEDLGAASGERVHAGLDQPRDRFGVGGPRSLRQVGDLHHGQRLQVHPREALLQAAEHLAVPIQRQFGVQSADDVKLRDRLAIPVARRFPRLLERHGVGARVLGPFAERAQPATRHANVGGVDVPVDVEVGDVAVQPLAHQVGHITHRQQVRCAVERQAVFVIEAHSCRGLFEYRLHALVLNRDFHFKPRSEEAGYRPPRNRRIAR